MLNNHLDRVFEHYKTNYEKIFNVLYPAKNSTGFTERNLSVNFCKAYETVYQNSITWYEFQFGEKNNLHYDALIIDPKSKVVLLIESKRFSNTNKKLIEVRSDINRICESINLYRSDFDRIDNFDAYKVVGVILADVWTENALKKDILKSFRDNSFLTRFSMPSVSSPLYYVTDFDSTEKYPVIRDTYHLTSLVWEIN